MQTGRDHHTSKHYNTQIFVPQISNWEPLDVTTVDGAAGGEQYERREQIQARINCTRQYGQRVREYEQRNFDSAQQHIRNECRCDGRVDVSNLSLADNQIFATALVLSDGRKQVLVGMSDHLNSGILLAVEAADALLSD